VKVAVKWVVQPQGEHQKGSMSTAMLATCNVGACNHLLKGKPKASAGPKWKGVNGIGVRNGPP